MQEALGVRTDLALPLRVEDITPAWMRDALAIDIDAIEVTDIISGTATKVMATVSLADGTEMSVCIKGGFTQELMASMSAAYQVEARFYGDLGPQIEGSVPRCHFAGVDAASGQGIVILDDLRAPGTEFGDPRRALRHDQVAAALAGQVPWHTMRDGLPAWLPRTPLWQEVIGGLLNDENWQRQLDGGKAAELPAELRDRDRYLAGLRASWRRDSEEPACVVHGDTNVTNLVITDGSAPWFLDWQLVCASHWAHDVALFLVGSLEVDQRREHEHALIAGYAQARRARGDDLDDAAAFDAYRTHLLHGVMYAFIPEEMQPSELCRPFVDRFAAAITDHSAFDLLGV